MSSKKRMVVVTTNKDLKGIFFGEYKSGGVDTGCVTLLNARMCVYFSASTHGVVGLAGNGPADGSKITPKCPKIDLNGVTSVMNCSAKAIKEWEKEKWN